MIMIRLFYIIYPILLVFTLTNAQSVKFDHSIFDTLLKENVDDNGMVNYDAFINNNEFKNYLLAIGTAEIIGYSNEEKLAFHINAYNATVIKNVVDHLPINSPMDVEGFFNKIKHNIMGKEITLDELEHKYALKIEPVLTHFGLVCAAKSCPKLITKAYNGENVFQLLEENGRVFLNDPDKNKIDIENKILYLSELFKWFGDSFKKKHGSIESAAIYFMSESDAMFLKESEVKVRHMKYNWELNKQ
jgi:hypothetical protein